MNDPQPNEAPIPVPLTLVPPTTETPTSVPPPAGPPTTLPPATVTPAPSITPSTIPTPDLKWITHLSSLVVILAAAAYLIGFIIVNTSLFRFGMVPYDFLQARNVSAGLLYLAATAGFTSFYASLIYLANESISSVIR